MRNKVLFNISVFTFFIAVLFLANCESELSENQQSAKYNGIIEVNSINNGQNIENGFPIMIGISHVITDKFNNIYLVDQRNQTIHSFTADLDYRWSVGHRGAGPGEYNRITSLFSTDSLLYVYDGPSTKMNIYNTMTGDRIKDHTFGESGHTIHNIRRNSNLEFITLGYNFENETIVNIYSDNFTKRIDHLVHLDDIITTDNLNVERQIFSNFSGSVFPLDDSTILYTPHHYNGQLAIYSKSDSGEWSQLSSVNGYKKIVTPRTIHFSDNDDHERSHLSGINPMGGYFHTEYESRSLGIFPLADESISHVSIKLTTDDTWDLVVEYFDQSDLSMSHFSVINESISDQRPQKLPVWMNPDGKLFVIENSDTPLRIYEIVRDDNDKK